MLKARSKQEIAPELKSQQAKRPRIIQITKAGEGSRNKGSCEASVQSDHDKDCNIPELAKPKPMETNDMRSPLLEQDALGDITDQSNYPGMTYRPCTENISIIKPEPEDPTD